jgi:hypothetical protein
MNSKRASFAILLRRLRSVDLRIQTPQLAVRILILKFSPTGIEQGTWTSTGAVSGSTHGIWATTLFCGLTITTPRIDEDDPAAPDELRRHGPTEVIVAPPEKVSPNPRDDTRFTIVASVPSVASTLKT